MPLMLISGFSMTFMPSAPLWRRSDSLVEAHIGLPGSNLRTVRTTRLNAPHSAFNGECPTATATRYQRSMIHFTPTTISQIAIVATDSTITAASKAIESRTPSSSR